MFGKPHDKCRAHNQSGKPCGKPPMAGMIVCRTHGGAKKSAKRNASERIAVNEVISKARKLIAFDADDSETPEDGLLRQVLWSGQITRALADIVKDLTDDTLTQRGMGGSVQLNVFMQWFTEERVTHAKLCKLAIDAGIEQRHIDILERQAGQIVSVIVAVLQSPRLNLTTEQITNGRVAAAEVLRALPAGAK
jgi:hypothetical protein